MKKSSLVRGVILISLIAIPSLLFVQAAQPTAASATTGILSLASLVRNITNNVLASLATLFMSLALLAFFYGIVEYIWGRRKGDATATKNGNQFMTWGLIALFVMFSVYGIIKFFQNTLAPGTDWSTITIPNIIFDSKAGTGSAAGTGGGGGTGTGSSPGTGGGGGSSGGSSTGTGGGGGGSLKADGITCSYSYECNSGFCNASSKCQTVSATSKLANGGNCYQDVQCTSSYCSPSTGQCATKPSTSKLANGVDCYQDAQCSSNYCSMNTGQCDNKPSSGGGSSTYSCSPGAECTMSGGGTGICNGSGTACSTSSAAACAAAGGGLDSTGACIMPD